MKKLRVRPLNIDAGGKTIVIISYEDSRDLGIRPLSRVVMTKGKRKLTVITDVARRCVREGEIVVYKEVQDILKLKSNDMVTVFPEKPLESKKFIHKKIHGNELDYSEISSIVNDVIDRNLSDLELASLITALHIHGMTMKENYFFSKAMLKTSKKINFGGTVVDKHSIGGVPGDKTTLLVVPIIAAAGLKIPKTSSRSITSGAGTADRMEVLAPVCLNIEKIKSVVRKCNGCIAWGGAVELAPADDLFIQIEHPLEIDPLLLPSVLSKKKSVGSKHVVIDIPVGIGAKMSTQEQAETLASRFIELGKMLDMQVECGITYASQPIGYTIGPALEAREALENLMRLRHTQDLVDKATSIAGLLFEMVGKGNKETALEIINSGKAEKKMREIIKAQGGDKNIMPDDIGYGKFMYEYKSDQSGVITGIQNRCIVHAAWSAGAPKDHLAGVLLNKKIGDYVNRGEKLFTIYSEKSEKLKDAVKLLNCEAPYVIVNNKKKRMLIEKVHSYFLDNAMHIKKKIISSRKKVLR